MEELWPKMDQDEFNIPEIKFNLTKFECLGRTFQCVLEDRQIPAMRKFFETLENTQLNWKEAKEICMNELLSIELPDYHNLKKEASKRFYKSSRSIYAFTQMERVSLVQDFILQIDRDRKLNKLV